MIDTSLASIQQAVVHVVGGQEEGIRISQSCIDLSEERLNLGLRSYFLSNFQSPEFFSFISEDERPNQILEIITNLFRDPSSLMADSVRVAEHLFKASQHPAIKPGELYVVMLSGLVIDNKQVDGVGIFKSETKELFLQVHQNDNTCDVTAASGTNIKKLDKGCIVFNVDQESGYKICIVDNTNRNEAQFWKDNFLQVKPWSDAFHHTRNFMNLTKEYLVDQMQEEFKVSKADQIDLMNRSVDFFKSRESFNQQEFEVEVLGDAGLIESFRKYEDAYVKEHDTEIADSFEISAQAVKRQAKLFKNVLKLDKNFHVYIHGDRDLIERGFDEIIGKNYYKIYFDSES